MENFQNLSDIFSLKTFKYETLPLVAKFSELDPSMGYWHDIFHSIFIVSNHFCAPKNLAHINFLIHVNGVTKMIQTELKELVAGKYLFSIHTVHSHTYYRGNKQITHKVFQFKSYKATDKLF